MRFSTGPHVLDRMATPSFELDPRFWTQRKWRHLPLIAFILVHFDPTNEATLTIFLGENPPRWRLPFPLQTVQGNMPSPLHKRHVRGGSNLSPGMLVFPSSLPLPLSRFRIWTGRRLANGNANATGRATAPNKFVAHSGSWAAILRHETQCVLIKNRSESNWKKRKKIQGEHFQILSRLISKPRAGRKKYHRNKLISRNYSRKLHHLHQMAANHINLNWFHSDLHQTDSEQYLRTQHYFLPDAILSKNILLIHYLEFVQP